VAIERDTCELLCLDAPMAAAVRDRLPDPQRVAAAALAAKAFGDPTRLLIAIALRDAGRACVCDLGFIVGRNEKLVSHHVRHLKGAGLAISQREGKMVMYELTSRGRALVDSLLTEPVHA
jgi:DNA-binding transcriptional ArsR family regulator